MGKVTPDFLVEPSIWLIGKHQNTDVPTDWRYESFSLCNIPEKRLHQRVCQSGQTEPGKCLLWEGLSLLSWELVGRREQAYRLLSIVKERGDLVILVDLLKFDWLRKLLKLSIRKSEWKKIPDFAPVAGKRQARTFPGDKSFLIESDCFALSPQLQRLLQWSPELWSMSNSSLKSCPSWDLFPFPEHLNSSLKPKVMEHQAWHFVNFNLLSHKWFSWMDIHCMQFYIVSPLAKIILMYKYLCFGLCLVP